MIHNENLSKMQSNYYPKNGYKVISNKLEPIARILLIAVYDDDDPFSVFRGMRYLVEKIWTFVIQFNRHIYSKHIEIKEDPIGNAEFMEKRWANRGKSIAFKPITQLALCHPSWVHWTQDRTNFDTLRFPEPLKEEININMMPLEINSRTIKDQIPSKLHGYLPYIYGCQQACPSFKGICYLTIHESFVKKGHTQRRPGLHIESPPGVMKIVNGKAKWSAAWGGGYNQRDGIFMASNVGQTCAVWNCRVESMDEVGNVEENVIGKNGNLEHLRSMMPTQQKYLLEAHRLYWITG